MIGVRKSLDLIFTKYELKALDDLMPESHKKHKDEDDDEEVGLEVCQSILCRVFFKINILYGWQAAAVGTGGQMPMNDYGRPSNSGQNSNIQIQLPNGNIMNIPVDNKGPPPAGLASGSAKAMNISEEVNRSGVWKTVNIGNVLPTCRNNRRREK